MAAAARDNNNIPTIIAALESDGVTITRVRADATTHALSVSDGTTGTDHGTAAAQRDANFVPVLMAVSSVDGVTPVEVYVDATGALLIQTT